jgi:hypothetical protein
MGGPSSVCNASMRVKDFGKVWFLLFNQCLQLGNFPHLFKGKDLIFLVTVNRQAS